MARTKACPICLKDEKSPKEARNCDRIHYHQYCGGKVTVGANGRLKCENGHNETVIRNYIVRSKEEAVKDPNRRW